MAFSKAIDQFSSKRFSWGRKNMKAGDTTLLSILIPLYNESATIGDVLERVFNAPLPAGVRREVIVIDDGSTDGGIPDIEKEKHPDLVLRGHGKNRGKGASIRTGLVAAQGDIVLIQDADLEYDPGEYTILIQPILQGKADVVYGSRLVTGSCRRVHLYRHFLANRFLTMVSNWFSNYNLSDMETCYKVFRTDMLTRITLKENRFGFEPEVTQKIARQHARVYEVGISYHGRDFNEGKKIRPYKDGLRALYCIVKYGLFG